MLHDCIATASTKHRVVALGHFDALDEPRGVAVVDGRLVSYARRRPGSISIVPASVTAARASAPYPGRSSWRGVSSTLELPHVAAVVDLNAQVPQFAARRLRPIGEPGRRHARKVI